MMGPFSDSGLSFFRFPSALANPTSTVLSL
jgi:hypothetical protein